MQTKKVKQIKQKSILQGKTEPKKLPAIILVAMLLAAIIGFFLGQSIAAYCTISTYKTYIIVEEPLVVEAEPSNGQIQLSTGENLTVKFSISSKSDQIQYKAIIIYFIYTSGYLSPEEVNMNWSGVDGYTTVEGYGETLYPWVYVPKTNQRGLPGPAVTVNCTISIPENAPSGSAIINFLIKRQ